jgi:hypothetical protein
VIRDVEGHLVEELDSWIGLTNPEAPTRKMEGFERTSVDMMEGDVTR